MGRMRFEFVKPGLTAFSRPPVVIDNKQLLTQLSYKTGALSEALIIRPNQAELPARRTFVEKRFKSFLGKQIAESY